MAFLEEGDRDGRVERMELEADDGATIEAIHAEPDGAAELGLVLHPDLMGVRPLFDEICRRLATHGIAVMAIEPFARIPAKARAGLDAAGRMERVAGLDDATQLGDLVGAGDFLAGAHGLERTSILGFCMGGMYTLKAAATGSFERAVPFYGMLRVPAHWQGPGQRDALDTAAGVCPTLAFFGDADPWVPNEHVDELRTVWADRPDCEIVVYPGADHGFVHDPERPVHRPDDAADVWARTLRFLRAG
jgi:carboxymethylenebutenolidase